MQLVVKPPTHMEGEKVNDDPSTYRLNFYGASCCGLRLQVINAKGETEDDAAIIISDNGRIILRRLKVPTADKQ
jgi:hypothetical protein